MTPMTTANVTQIMSAIEVSRSVAGIRSKIMSVTGRPALIDRPRSPWMMPFDASPE